MNCSTLEQHLNNSSLRRFNSYYTFPTAFLVLLCNAVALWCVVGCPRTRPAVKVLLCAPFASILLLCLILTFEIAYFLGMCDDKEIIQVFIGTSIVVVIVAVMESWYIFIIAVVRTVAVWSTQRHHLKLRTSVGLVVGVPLWSAAITVALVSILSLTGTTIMTVATKVSGGLLYFLPVVLTLACYCSMIFVVRRNKRRLAATQDTAATGQVMDQVTRAMLAVFVSNLVLVLPMAIRVILHTVDKSIFLGIEILFKTHMFVDPVVFVCFNSHHRTRVLQALRSCQQWVCCCPPCTLPHTTDILPLHPLQNVAEGQ